VKPIAEEAAVSRVESFNTLNGSIFGEAARDFQQVQVIFDLQPLSNAV